MSHAPAASETAYLLGTKVAAWFLSRGRRLSTERQAKSFRFLDELWEIPPDRSTKGSSRSYRP
jgi:hypothetical protein